MRALRYLTLCLLLALSVAPAPASAAAADAKVSVVHGIPGQPVDVYVNGKKTIPNFQPGKVAGPLSLPAGSYDIALTKPGDPIGSALLKADDTAVTAGANISLVAHLSSSGDPALTPFVNDTARLAPGKARLIVRHTAAAPAVDVRAGGKPVFRDLTNPKQAAAVVDAGTVAADVVLAGTGTRVLGPADLNLREGTATIVYAIGSADAKSLDLLTQTITGLHSSPGGVPSGTGGQVARTEQVWSAIGLLGVLLLLIGAASIRGRRSTDALRHD